ncbi:MAG: PLP-dependent transferase [Lentimonas sp.]
MDSFRYFPLGAPFPESPHAVISSLPTMADVRGYEEHEPRVVEAMASGYPRFVVHTYIRQLVDFYCAREGLAGCFGVLIPNRRAAQDCVSFLGEGVTASKVADALFLVSVDAAEEALAYRLRKYVQHTGCGISSRQAEDILVSYGKLECAFAEESYFGAPLPEAERLIAEQVGCRTEDVLVCASGMNAFYAGYRAVQEFQSSRGRKRWLQLGWLYLDSSSVLKEFLHTDETLECIYDVFDLDAVKERIRSYGDELSAVVVEVPTNPLIQVCELQAIADLVREQGGVMIVDPTIASIYNVDVLPFTDLLVSSLTKYAATEGDVMIGALAVNKESPYYGDLVLRISAFYQPPYSRDLARLVYEMENAPVLVAQMNDNAARLRRFLNDHPKVERVDYALSSEQFANVAKSEHSGGAVISIVLKDEIDSFYDSIQLMKGPSFGARFTLLCPFVYLAHYDLVICEEGRAFLASVGVDPELIRISVGTEPYEEIEAVFAAALDVLNYEGAGTT